MAATVVPKQHIRLVLAHATGFCKEAWKPVIAQLSTLAPWLTTDVVAFDFTAHGDRGHVPMPSPHWFDFIGNDVIEAATRTPLPPGGTTIAVGHSMGAAAVAYAAALRPELFSKIVLVEPISPPGAAHMDAHPAKDNPLSLMTLARRSEFPSREEAIENWRGKGMFELWEPESLEAYAEGAIELRDDNDGKGMVFRLKCRKENEAKFYRAATGHGWDALPDITASTLVLAGEHSKTKITGRDNPDMTAADAFKLVAARIPGAKFDVVEGATHFYPQEQPKDFAQRIVNHVLSPHAKL